MPWAVARRRCGRHVPRSLALPAVDRQFLELSAVQLTRNCVTRDEGDAETHLDGLAYRSVGAERQPGREDVELLEELEDRRPSPRARLPQQPHVLAQLGRGDRTGRPPQRPFPVGLLGFRDGTRAPGLDDRSGSASHGPIVTSGPRVAINGFGRIGRNVYRAALERQDGIDIIAVNDVNDPAMLAYLVESTRYGDICLHLSSWSVTSSKSVTAASACQESANRCDCRGGTWASTSSSSRRATSPYGTTPCATSKQVQGA